MDAIQQMSYLIFLKRLEDTDNDRAVAAKRKSEAYRSVFHGTVPGTKIPAKECRWSHWSPMPGEQMLNHVRERVFPFLRGLGKETSSFAQQMQNVSFIIEKATLLQDAVKLIEEMHIHGLPPDMQGDLYEYLLMQLTTAGMNGQFRTPRHIIRMMVKLVDPKVGDRICDPAAGTGGFLVAAYQHILEMNTSKDVLEYDDEGIPHHLIGDMISDKKQLKFLKSYALTGYDFDATMTRIGAMNLMLHGIDNPNFRYMDTLSKAFTEKAKYDVILANPPFKGSIDKSDINERFSLKTTKTELLFIELMYDLLDSGGRCGVIVPDGVLFGTSNAHINTRKILLDKCKLEGVISMPSGVFKPYAGVSTAVLVFQKGGTTDNVWFYDMEADGFSLDDKRQKVVQNDIPDIIEKWNTPLLSPLNKGGRKGGGPAEVTTAPLSLAAETKEDYKGTSKKPSPSESVDRTGKCFYISAEEIRANKYDLSISRYKQIEHKEIEYEKPEVIMAKVQKLEKEIEKGIDDIGKMIGRKGYSNSENAEKSLRELAKTKGLDWDSMSDEERTNFLDGLVHETRSDVS